MLIVIILLNFQTFPIVYSLMSKRSTAAYSSVLKFIHENLIPIEGQSIIIDFEKSMRLALIKLNTGIMILGCWFHHCQCLRRKLASMPELHKLVRSNDKMKSIFRQFQCLALLPHDLIEPTFIELSKEALKLSPLFAPFIDYYYNEWIKIVKPIHFSVFMRGMRTTSSAEAINGQINKRFKTHGNFFHFCESMQKEEVVIVEALQNDIGGSIQKNNQTKFYKRRNVLISKYSSMLKKEEITSMQFLKTMANEKNRVLYADSDISESPVEVDLAMQTELYGNVDTATYVEVDEFIDDDANMMDENETASTSNNHSSQGKILVFISISMQS